MACTNWNAGRNPTYATVVLDILSPGTVQRHPPSCEFQSLTDPQVNASSAVASDALRWPACAREPAAGGAVFYCGNFGLILFNLMNQPEVLKILRKMTEVNEITVMASLYENALLLLSPTLMLTAHVFPPVVTRHGSWAGMCGLQITMMRGAQSGGIVTYVARGQHSKVGDDPPPDE
jgi:hypothetical protein